MGLLFSLFLKKHANVDVECNGCACHADDKSSSSDESHHAPKINHVKKKTPVKDK